MERNNTEVKTSEANSMIQQNPETILIRSSSVKNLTSDDNVVPLKMADSMIASLDGGSMNNLKPPVNER